MKKLLISSLIAATMFSPAAQAAEIPGSPGMETVPSVAAGEFKRGARNSDRRREDGQVERDDRGREDQGERQRRRGNGNWQGNNSGGGVVQQVEGQQNSRGRDWNSGEERRVEQRDDRGERRRDANANGRYYDRNRDGNMDRRWDGNRDDNLDRRWDRNNDERLDRRWDRNDDERLDRRWDGNRNGDLDRRHDRNNNDRYDRSERHSRWDRSWRSDRRYDWRGHRERYRNYYRPGRYYAPDRYHSYRRFSIGITIGSPYYSNRYWIADPWYYRLPAAHGPYRWVRYYDDVLLIDIRDGYVVDVIHDFFW